MTTVGAWGFVLAVASSTIPAAGPAPAAGLTAGAALVGIHVVHPVDGAPYLADAAGDAVLLRGVDSNALVQYSDRPGCSYQETVPLHPQDFEEMAALGVDFLRLAVSWSRIEPAPGVFSTAYLDTVRSTIQAAGRAGIAVLVDMHQDRYNRHLWCGQEVDGAPDWATVTAGTPCLDLELSTLCAQVATQAFWSDATVDGRGLEQWYLGALEALARAVGSAPNLAGIELMNEPTPGFVPPVAFELTELYPFYQEMIAGLRSSGYRRPIWFEPSVLRDETDNARLEAVRFSGDPQLVYAVHIYTGVFSAPQGPDNSELQLVQSYASAAAEAAVFGTPWVDDEFGATASPSWDTWISRQLALQNRYVVGSGFWLWKQQPGFYGWGVVRPDGALRSSTDRAQLLSLPHPDSVPGRLVSTELEGSSLDGALPTRPTGLVTQVDTTQGGVATFWSGTVVEHGGSSILARPFSQVTVNGRLVPATCRTTSFERAGVDLGGCIVAVDLPAGADRVVLDASG